MSEIENVATILASIRVCLEFQNHDQRKLFFGKIAIFVSRDQEKSFFHFACGTRVPHQQGSS
jgi:hypothetical protein